MTIININGTNYVYSGKDGIYIDYDFHLKLKQALNGIPMHYLGGILPTLNINQKQSKL